MTLSIHLGVLEGAGLIRLASVQPELEYLFRHMLVKEAAYHSLVKGDRRSLHRAVGETIERLYSGTARDAQPVTGAAGAALASEIYPLLAFHFAEAGDAARAQRYFTLAGEAAAATYANMEAAAHFTQAVEAALRAGAPAADLIQLHTRLGRVQELRGDYAGALKTYAGLDALGQARGDRAMVLAALVPQAVIRAVPSASVDTTLAASLTAQAIALARELGDRATEARALWARLLYELSISDSAEAVRSGQAALAIAREQGLPELTALVLGDLGRAYTGGGQFDESLAALDEARELLRSLGNQPMLAENLADTGGAYLLRGDHQRALGWLDEAFHVSQAIGNAWGQSYSLMLQGFAYLYTGSLQQAVDSLVHCIELAAEGGFAAPLIEGRMGLALIYANLGQIERAREEIRASRQLLGDAQFRVLAALSSIEAMVDVLAGDLEAAEARVAEARAGFELGDLTSFAAMFVPLAEGGLALARGDYARAAAAPVAILALERKIGLHVLRTDLLLAQGRALIGLGRLEEAEALLMEARAEADARHGRNLLWAVLAAQALVAERRGDQPLASQLRRQARDAVETLAAQLTDPGLRGGLLNRPDVQALANAEAAPP